MSSRSGYTRRIPVEFEHKGKKYTGELCPMAGGERGCQVMLNGFYFGNLLYRNGWVLPDSKLSELANFFGEVLTAGEDSQME